MADTLTHKMESQTSVINEDDIAKAKPIITHPAPSKHYHQMIQEYSRMEEQLLWTCRQIIPIEGNIMEKHIL